MLLRRALFWFELMEYEKYIPLATVPSIEELRQYSFYENLSVGSKRLREHGDCFFRGFGKPSWYETDKYRMEEHVGAKWLAANIGKRNKKDIKASCNSDMEIWLGTAVESNREDIVQHGMDGYVSEERSVISYRLATEVADRYLSRRDYRKAEKWGYREDIDSSFHENLSHYIVYCADVIERNGLPCLLLTKSDGDLRKNKKKQYQDSMFGLLSYPLRGISMEKAKVFKNKLLLVDGVKRGFMDNVDWYRAEDAEMIYRGINPYVTLRTDKDYNLETDWKDPNNAHVRFTINAFNKAHETLVKRYGSDWTKKDTLIRIGYVRRMREEELPEHMRIDWERDVLLGEGKEHFLPNFDIMRIRLTPFTFDGVVSFKEYVKVGCPVYEFSMYGARARNGGKYDYVEGLPRRDDLTMLADIGCDECDFDDMYAVKLGKEQMDLL